MADEELEDRGDFIEDESEEEVVEDESSDDEDEELEPQEQEDEDEDEDAEEDESVSEDDEDEGSDEEDESEDTEEGEDEVEEDPDDTGNQRVPRSRLNQVIQQREEERARAAWLEEQLETLIGQRQTPDAEPEPKDETPLYDFDDAEERYGNFLLEGDTKQAGAVRKEMNGERDKLYQKQIDDVKAAMKVEASEASKASLEDDKFDTFLNKTFSARAYLDDASDDYNERAVKMANSLMTSYMKDGMTKTKALGQAVEDIAPLFEEKPTLGKKKSTTRTKNARRKAAKANDQQPPSTSRKSRGKGTRDLEDLRVDKLSEKDFNSLTKKELAILRGD